MQYNLQKQQIYQLLIINQIILILILFQLKYKTSTMIQYLVTFFLFIVITIYYKFYYHPKKELQSYKNKLEALGYKVKLFPYKFLGCPLITQYLQSSKNKGDMFYNYKNQYFKYDILIYNKLSTPILQFQNQQIIRNFFQPENIYVHYKMPFEIKNIQRALGLGIPFSQGKQWKRKRNIMNTVFNYEFISQNISKIVRICQQNIKLVQKDCQEKGKVEQKDGKKAFKTRIFDIFANTYSNVMLECFFGVDSTHEQINNQSVAQFINKLNADVSKQNYQLPIILFGAKFAEYGFRKKDRDINQRIKSLRQLASKFIKKRLAQLKQTGPRVKYQDIIEALVLNKSIDTSQLPTKIRSIKSEAENYDFGQLIQQFCTFFTAGTDTTSHFTQMMIYYISQRKDIQQKLRSLINEVIKKDEDITIDNLKKLKYIDWIQNQTTRFYGPGNGIFTRVAQKDHFIGNIQVKKGTGLGVQPTSSHYSEKYFKNPQQFKPQRWESEASLSNLLGFGGGPRTCIGKHLAMLESKIALIKFMKRYGQFYLPKQNFRMIPKFMYLPEPMDMTLVPNN